MGHFSLEHEAPVTIYPYPNPNSSTTLTLAVIRAAGVHHVQWRQAAAWAGVRLAGCVAQRVSAGRLARGSAAAPVAAEALGC